MTEHEASYKSVEITREDGTPLYTVYMGVCSCAWKGETQWSGPLNAVEEARKHMDNPANKFTALRSLPTFE